MIFTRDYEDIRKEFMRKAVDDKMLITSHDIALRMGVHSEPSAPITVVDSHEWIRPSEIYQRITRAIEWLYDANVAYEKGKGPLISMKQYIYYDKKFEYPISNNTIMNADSASIVGADSSINTESIYNVSTSTTATIDCSGTICAPVGLSHMIDSGRVSCEDLRKLLINDAINTDCEPEKKAELKKEPEPAPLPVLDNYWKQGDSLVVKWTDGTVTIVTAEDPERATLFAGICIAYVKKVLGSTTAISKQIDKVQQKKDWPRRKREIEKEKLKELKESVREREANIREMKIREETEKILIHHEASRRAFDKTLKAKDGVNNA